VAATHLHCFNLKYNFRHPRARLHAGDAATITSQLQHLLRKIGIPGGKPALFRSLIDILGQISPGSKMQMRKQLPP
jgi:hypothetical protein